jgi:hypothetical protein
LTEPEKNASVVVIDLGKYVLRKIESIDRPSATGRNRVRRIGKGLVCRLEKTEVDVMDIGPYREDIRSKEYSVCMANEKCPSSSRLAPQLRRAAGDVYGEVGVAVEQAGYSGQVLDVQAVRRHEPSGGV